MYKQMKCVRHKMCSISTDHPLLKGLFKKTLNANASITSLSPVLLCLVVCQECVNIPVSIWAITPAMGVFEMSWQERLNCSQRKLSLPKGWDLWAPVVDLVTHSEPFRLVTHQIMKANEESNQHWDQPPTFGKVSKLHPKFLMGLEAGGRSTARVAIGGRFLN